VYQIINISRQKNYCYLFICRKAKDTYVRLRKERDYHRMHHKRIVQEKNRLITDLRRLRDHYSCYEPALRTLKTKYETAMKEKMLSKLERDRIMGEVQGLKSALKTKELTQLSNGMCSQNSLPGDLASHLHNPVGPTVCSSNYNNNYLLIILYKQVSLST